MVALSILFSWYSCQNYYSRANSFNITKLNKTTKERDNFQISLQRPAHAQFKLRRTRETYIPCSFSFEQVRILYSKEIRPALRCSVSPLTLPRLSRMFNKYAGGMFSSASRNMGAIWKIRIYKFSLINTAGSRRSSTRSPILISHKTLSYQVTRRHLVQSVLTVTNNLDELASLANSFHNLPA